MKPMTGQMPHRQQLPLQQGTPPGGQQQQPPASLYQKPRGGRGGRGDQAQYDMFMANGISKIHDPKYSEMLIKRIAQAADPTDAIARATFDVVLRLDSSARESGMELSPTVLINGSNELMGEIITLAEAAGMKPLTDEQKYQAFSLATALYLDNAVKSGQITQEQLQQMGNEVRATPQGQKIAQQISGGGDRMPSAQAQSTPQQNPPPEGGLLQGRRV